MCIRDRIYISFVEGDPNKSDFQVSSTGDRSYFYFHNLDDLKAKLIENKFNELNTLKVEYERSVNEIEMHTIVTAKKKTTG